MGIFGGSPQEQVDLDDLKARVARLEAAVTRLQAERLGDQSSTDVTPDDTWLLEVRALKRQGQMIPAIKLYREHSGLGLKEAKDAVEALY